MNTQSKSRLLITVIGILLVTNIILLSFFLLKKDGQNKQDHKSPMGNYLQNEIGFSKQQMTDYEKIKVNHKSQVKTMFDKMRENKAEAFKEVGNKGFADSAINAAAEFSAMQQKDLEINMLQHLREVRNICTPQQQQKFDTSFYKIMNRPKDAHQ